LAHLLEYLRKISFRFGFLNCLHGKLPRFLKYIPGLIAPMYAESVRNRNKAEREPAAMTVIHRSGFRLAASALLLGILLGSGAVALVCALRNPKTQVHASPYPRETARVTFVAAGDVIPHQPVVQSAAAHKTDTNHDGWDALFADVADLFQSADYGFVNLETPVAPAHSRGSKPFMFDAPVALIDALKTSGVKIVSFANNHVMDQGWAGFTETREHLTQQGLQFAGTGDTAQSSWKPVILEKQVPNGPPIRIGVLGMTRWLNGNKNPDKPDSGDAQPHVNFFPYPNESGGAPGLDEVQVLEAVKAARAQCDFLVLSIHWGIEYAPAPRPEDTELAHKLMEAGATVLLGHHPHVLQPVETYLTQDNRSTVIFYSLGNFLSNQSRTYIDGVMPDKDGEPRESLMVRFAAIQKDYGPAGKRVELGSVGIYPAWQENNRNQLQRGKDSTPFIHPVLIDRVIAPLSAQVEAFEKKGTDLTPEEKPQYIEAVNKLKSYQHQREQILARTGDEYVLEPPKQDPPPAAKH
jgi:poly-gamma-glutamate capsule biosynthesis protein CapA/YwtB (metallophosphatase superfamily)